MLKQISNSLGTEPISKLLRQYAMPAIIAMTAASLYNMADAMFIGRGVGAMALSGMAVTFPFSNILAAFGSLVGVGSGAILSIKLGQRDYDSAGKVLGNAVMLNIIISGIVGLLGFVFLEPILTFFGASPQTMIYAKEYMEIILAANFFTHIYFALNHVLRSSGHPYQSMYATIVSVVLNVVLDPVFIFVFDMGIRGAAVATVLSQLIAIIWQAILLSNPKELVHFSRSAWHLEKRMAIDILSIGLSPFLMNFAHCIVVIIINRQLFNYGGDLAVGAYGVINRVTFIFCAIVMGLNQAMQPIAGYNYGAEKYHRMLEVFKQTALWATAITTCLFFTGVFFPQYASYIFTDDKALVDISASGMRIVCSLFFLNGYQMVAGNFFTSIGMAGKSIFLSLTRQVLYLIPLLLLLPPYWGIDGVWWSMPLSDILSFTTATIMVIVQVRKFRRKITIN
ncbi:MAG: MATE family efflux transporter [Paludibacteraceae bacterium]|nr:MATE family efflux transporter [Paludibacteraceae bacterium]